MDFYESKSFALWKFFCGSDIIRVEVFGLAKILTDAQREHVLALYFENGKTAEEISKMVGISTPTIYKWVNKKKTDDLLTEVGKSSDMAAEEDTAVPALDPKTVGAALENLNRRIKALEQENLELRQCNERLRVLVENLVKSFLA